MFFYISKITTFLIDPVFILILFTFLSWLVSRKRIRHKLKSLFIIFVFYLLSTDLIATSLFSILENAERRSPISTKYDTVIALSGMTRPDVDSLSQDIEFTEAVDRILTAINIVKSGKADYLIISGGNGSLTQNQYSEATALEDFATRWGLTSDQIILDADSRNTFENAVNTSRIIQERGFERNLMVTSAFHMIRAKGCFRAAGLDVDAYPVDFRVGKKTGDFRIFLPSASALHLSGDFIHELVGIIVYGLTDKATYFR